MFYLNYDFGNRNAIQFRRAMKLKAPKTPRLDESAIRGDGPNNRRKIIIDLPIDHCLNRSERPYKGSSYSLVFLSVV